MQSSAIARRTLRRLTFALAAMAVPGVLFAAAASDSPPKPLNFLLITADDMNYSSPGVFGCAVPDITPNIDRLASEGLRFVNGHVAIAVCQPSREALMTGRYPHRNGGEGFQPINLDVPTLQEQLHAAGYLNGIMGKNSHLAPREKFCWDFYIEPGQLGQGRNPQAYYNFSKEYFEKAKAEGKPFFLMANSQDPHRPFAGSDQEMQKWKKHVPFDRQILPAEAQIPGFLPDIPDVRREVAEYFTSVHRCDETVGAVLRALEETGFQDNTLVMFLSDNGMSFPFAKTNCYLTSTKTPWIVRWPGKAKPATVNTEDFISGIDYMPTILEAAGLAQVPGMDGASFVPLLLGRPQEGRDRLFTEFHETSGRLRFPMRCLQTRKYGYLVNFWSDAKRVFKNESQSGLSFKAMQEAAKTSPPITERVQMFQFRVPEEFYDFEKDPDALLNLIADPQCQGEIQKFRQTMLDWMTRTGDPALEAYTGRQSPEAWQRFMADQQAKADVRKKKKAGGAAKGKGGQAPRAGAKKEMDD